MQEGTYSKDCRVQSAHAALALLPRELRGVASTITLRPKATKN